MSMSTVSRRSC